MELVFVCSPLRGDYKKNIEKARKYCKYIVDNCDDKIPIAPHIYFTQFLDDKIEYERDLGIKFGLRLLMRCSEIYVFPDYDSRITDGMKKEIDLAKSLKIPIHYINLGEVV